MSGHGGVDAGGDLSARVVGIIAQASGGLLSEADIRAATSLRATGLGSLEYLRLADALEDAFAIEIEVETLVAADAVDGVVALVAEQL